jgi:hypothetical protein
LVHYNVPSKLSEEEKDLLEKLKEVSKMPSKQEKMFKKLIDAAKGKKVDD